MTATSLQGSLFDVADAGGPVFAELAGARRTELGRGAWVDVLPGWLTGSDDLFELLLERVDWQAERRPMYDRVVDVPRLTRFFAADEPLPDPLVDEARDRLSAHYAKELGEPFATAGMCLYRDGRDSVAWHGDRIGRSANTDTMVAILSLGSARHLSLRPRDGGAARRYPSGHGDLIVMGGSCQRTFDHGVAKTARTVGPRISVQFRVAGVR